MLMTFEKLRAQARVMMAIGSAAIIAGAGIMVHGEMTFGDGVLIGGIVLLIVGVIFLAQTPTGDNDAD